MRIGPVNKKINNVRYIASMPIGARKFLMPYGVIVADGVKKDYFCV